MGARRYEIALRGFNLISSFRLSYMFSRDGEAGGAGGRALAAPILSQNKYS